VIDDVKILAIETPKSIGPRERLLAFHMLGVRRPKSTDVIRMDAQSPTIASCFFQRTPREGEPGRIDVGAPTVTLAAPDHRWRIIDQPSVLFGVQEGHFAEST
jgi:hypothetical protein